MAAVTRTRTGRDRRLWRTAHRHRRRRVPRLAPLLWIGQHGHSLSLPQPRPILYGSRGTACRTSVHPPPAPHTTGALLWSMAPCLQGYRPHPSVCHGAASRMRERVPRARGMTPETGTPPALLRFGTLRPTRARATLPHAPGAMGAPHGPGAGAQYSIPPGTHHCWVASSWRSHHRETAAPAALL